MKFSSLSLVLLISVLLFLAFSTLTDDKKAKDQKSNALKVQKVLAASTKNNALGKKVQFHAKNHDDGKTPKYISALRSPDPGPAWKYEGTESIKNYSKMEKTKDNRRFEAAKQMTHPIFSSGYSTNVCSVLNSFLGDLFKQEADKAFQSFASGTTDIPQAGISKGFATNNWKINGDLDETGRYFFNVYNADNRPVKGKTPGLSKVEFTYMAINIVYDYGLTYECQNCFQETRKEIKKFFTFLDCDNKGFIHAINLYDVLKQLKGGEKIKSTEVNDWLLKEDYRGIGRLDNKQFAEAVLKSLYELNILSA